MLQTQPLYNSLLSSTTFNNHIPQNLEYFHSLTRRILSKLSQLPTHHHQPFTILTIESQSVSHAHTRTRQQQLSVSSLQTIEEEEEGSKMGIRKTSASLKISLFFFYDFIFFSVTITGPSRRSKGRLIIFFLVIAFKFVIS